MSKTIEATYDGTMLRLSEPLDILSDTKVWVTIDTDRPAQVGSFLLQARAAELDGPTDWSENLDTYLYGNPSGD